MSDKRIIYAEDAIKAVHDLYAIFGSEGEWVDRKDVFEAIDSLPSAQPKQEQPTNIQDILEYLDTVLHPIVSPEHWNVYSELYDMISALPPAQPQPCKDAVSKADVLETYAELYDVFDDNKEIKNELHKIYDKINALHAAQPQRMKGQWKVTPVYIKCSECGESFMLIPQNFCPNCGAKMGVEDEQ